MRIPKFIALLIATLACNSTFADVDEDFESHPLGTFLSAIGFEVNIDYQDVIVGQVGRNNSRGFELIPGDTFDFTYFGVDENGLNPIGSRIIAGVDFRLRNANVQNSNPASLILLQFNPPNFGNQLFGGIHRTDQNSENFQLSLSDIHNGSQLSDKITYSELGLVNNVPGEWTDWLRLEIDVRKVAQNSFDVTLTLYGSNSIPLLAVNVSGWDLSAALENAISFNVHHDRNVQVADQIRFDNFSYRVIFENVVDFSASSFLTLRGNLESGGLNEVLLSDDNYLSFTPGFTLNNTEPPVWLEFDGQTTEPNADALVVQLEGNANTPGITQMISLFNWTTSQFDLADSRDASFNSDSVATVSIAEADNYLQSGTVKAQCGWRQTGFTILFPWQVSIDQVGWTLFN